MSRSRKGALALSVVEREYVAAARVLGIGRMRLLLRYVLPNIADTLSVQVIVLPLIILLTQSRGAFIALAVFGVIVARKHARTARTAVVMGAALVALIFLTPADVWKRLGTIGRSHPVLARLLFGFDLYAAV